MTNPTTLRTRPRAATLIALGALLLSACGDHAADAPTGQDTPEARAAQPTTPVVESAPTLASLQEMGYTLGSPDAPVVVVEFSDFGCPYCARFALETLPVLQDEFIGTGQVRWQYVPFVIGMFPNGGEAALAAECAAEQGRFWPMHDLLYERQREWRASNAPTELFHDLAAELGLDEERFAGCYEEERPAEKLAAQNRVADQLGIRGTPSFVVNGRPVQGALPLEQFRMLLNWAGAPGAGAAASP